MGPGLYSLRMLVNLYQYHGTVGLFNSRSIPKRFPANSIITSDFRNNTNIACSQISINKIFLFMSLFSVLCFLKVSEYPFKQNKNCLLLFTHSKKMEDSFLEKMWLRFCSVSCSKYVCKFQSQLFEPFF